MRFKTMAALVSITAATGALSLPPRPAWATTSRSQEWAGYQAVPTQHAVFQSVKASWTVPTIDCSGATIPGIPVYFDWVGLGSGSSNVTEQIGISEICSQTTPVWYTYLEVGGSPALSNVPQGPTITNVAGGDQVAAEVSYLPARRKYRFSMTDVSQGEAFARSMTCGPGITCGRSRAYVGVGISPAEEAPPAITLENYGSVPFFAVGITDSRGYRGAFAANKHWNSIRTNEFDLSKPAAVASSLSLHGTAFTDYWRGH